MMNQEKGLEVVAISIDKEHSALQGAITKRQYKWINSSELARWEGKTERSMESGQHQGCTCLTGIKG